MNLNDIVNNLLIDTKGSPSGISFTPDSSLGAFLPETMVCVTIVLLLLLRVFAFGRRLDVGLARSTGAGSAFYLALIGTAVALWLAAPWKSLMVAVDPTDPAAVLRMEIFTGMLVYDTFTVYVRTILLLFALLFIIFTRLSGIPDHEDGPDIYCLILGSTLGMCLMASANHLLMVFMAVEMASVPSYALAGMMKGRRQGSEAALKYAVYGAGAAGVMLYGISLIAGLLNTAHLPTIAVQLAEKLPTMQGGEMMVLALGGLMMGVGLAFKLSAVPFHFWCPDVFEGATAEVNAFLSVASKAAALALLVRVSLGIGSIHSDYGSDQARALRPGARTAARLGTPPQEAKRSSDQVAALFNLADKKGKKPVAAPTAKKDGAKKGGAKKDGAKKDAGKKDGAKKDAAKTAPPPDPAEKAAASPQKRVVDVAQSNKTLQPVRDFLGKLIAFIAIITCTFGNLAAYGQSNIKRLLAYSTIAHAGYMMMPVAAMVALAGSDPGGAERAVSGLAIYMFVYLFMNLGAFAIIAFLRNTMRSEEISDYAGLLGSCKFVVVSFALILFSLVGLPPLAGFIGKFAIFASLYDAYRETSQFYTVLLLVVGGMNTAVSLFYYLRVVKVMTMDPEPDSRTPFSLPFVSLQGFFVFALVIPTVVLIVCWNGLNELAIAAARYLL